MLSDINSCLTKMGPIFEVLADIVTIIGIVAIFGTIWQTYQSNRIRFEDSLNKEYRGLMRPIPVDVLNESISTVRDSSPELREARECIYNYFDLCNQQIYLRKIKRISDSCWSDWRDGIRGNFFLPSFKEVWEEDVKRGTFTHLEDIADSGFKDDPKDWSN